MGFLDSEFQSFVAVAENDLSKREVLDLCTDREPFVADRKLRLCALQKLLVKMV